MRPVVAVALLLLAWVPSVVASCTCWSSEEDRVAIEEPIAAKIVMRDTTGLELAGGPHYVVVPTGIKSKRTYFLVVEGYQRRPLAAHWGKDDALELTGDDAAARLAFRGPDQDWTVVFLQGDDHLFFDAQTVADLDWSKVETFTVAAPRLFAHRALNKQGCVVEEVEQADGDAGVATLLIATAGEASPKAWDKAMGKLPEAEKKKVTAELRRRLLAGEGGDALERALRHVALDDPVLTDRLVAVAKDEEVSGAGRARALHAVGQQQPATGAAVACAALQGKSAPGPLRARAFEILTETKTPCALTGWVPSYCDAARRCEGERGCGGADERMVAWVDAVKPPAFETARKRRGYAVEQGGGACAEAFAKGTACTHDAAALRHAACRLADGDRLELGPARARVDDPGRRIHEVVARHTQIVKRMARSGGRTCVAYGAPPTIGCWNDGAQGPPEPVAALQGGHQLAGGDGVLCAGVSEEVIRCVDETGAAHDVAVDGYVTDLAVAEGRGCAMLRHRDLVCFSTDEDGTALALAETPRGTAVHRSEGALRVTAREPAGVWGLLCDDGGCARGERLWDEPLRQVVGTRDWGAFVTRGKATVLRDGAALEGFAALNQLVQTPARICGLAKNELWCTDGRTLPATAVRQDVYQLAASGSVVASLGDEGLFFDGDDGRQRITRFGP